MTAPTPATGRDGNPELRFDGVGQCVQIDWPPSGAAVFFDARDPSTFEVDDQGRVSSIGKTAQPVRSKRPQLVTRP